MTGPVCGKRGEDVKGEFEGIKDAQRKGGAP
jgi:hypothetical protein